MKELDDMQFIYMCSIYVKLYVTVYVWHYLKKIIETI